MQRSLFDAVIAPAPKPALPAAAAGDRRSQAKEPRRRKLTDAAAGALLSEASGILAAYHDAALALERRRMIGLYAMLTDVINDLYPGTPAYSGSEQLMSRLAAPIGQEPMHGQAGKFFVTIAGAMCGVTYEGALRFSGLTIEAVRFDRPWLTSGGHLFPYEGVGPLDMKYRNAGETVSRWVERIICGNARVDDASAIKLVELRRRASFYRSDTGHQEIDEPLTEPIRPWHPDWQPGGWLYEASRAGPSGPS